MNFTSLFAPQFMLFCDWGDFDPPYLIKSSDDCEEIQGLCELLNSMGLGLRYFVEKKEPEIDA